MDKSIIPIEAIQERDIDLLLLEELNVNTDFSKWFVNELAIDKLTESEGAWRSISEVGLGETDIIFIYKSYAKKIFVLIENKLDTSFQKNQFERYILRGNKYKKELLCDELHIVLIAPQSYIDSQNYFLKHFSYEKFANWFIKQNSSRSKFKSELFSIAINRNRRGYKAIISEPVTDFFLKYKTFKDQLFPEASMKELPIRTTKQDWPEIEAKEFKNIRFIHKLKDGNVDMQIVNTNFDLIREIIVHLPKHFTIKENAKSYSIRISTRSVDRFSDFDEQREYVKEGILKLKELWNWALMNKHLFID